MVYEVNGGSGSGYVEDWTVWYNLTTRRNEIGYLSDYHNEGNVASSVYEIRGIEVLFTNVLDDEANSVLELSVHMQLRTKYWITQEDIEDELPAPEPDKIVAQTQVQLYYDKTELMSVIHFTSCSNQVTIIRNNGLSCFIKRNCLARRFYGYLFN